MKTALASAALLAALGFLALREQPAPRAAVPPAPAAREAGGAEERPLVAAEPAPGIPAVTEDPVLPAAVDEAEELRGLRLLLRRAETTDDQKIRIRAMIVRLGGRPDAGP